jgi:hypothetical protein
MGAVYGRPDFSIYPRVIHNKKIMAKARVSLFDQIPFFNQAWHNLSSGHYLIGYCFCNGA